MSQIAIRNLAVANKSHSALCKSPKQYKNPTPRSRRGPLGQAASVRA